MRKQEFNRNLELTVVMGSGHRLGSTREGQMDYQEGFNMDGGQGAGQTVTRESPKRPAESKQCRSYLFRAISGISIDTGAC